ncbi:hypothetical protein MRB53_040322 [Persea americana]|nr:hypothetical protein MRB53_040322 [Persea americana]
MTNTDFAAAQQRIAARRQQRTTNGTGTTPRKEERLPTSSASVVIHGVRSGWDRIKGREGTRPAFRVGQVDAELLDDELLELLKSRSERHSSTTDRICETTGQRRFCWCCAGSSSNYLYGTTMLPTALLCKIYTIPTHDSRTDRRQDRNRGRRLCMDSSRSVVGMPGASGRTDSWTRKAATMSQRQWSVDFPG